MKRLALILLALLLCLSLCITGCDTDDDSTTKAPSANNGGNNTSTDSTKPIDKAAAVEIFNSFDINSVFEDADLSPDTLLNTLNGLTFGAEGVAKYPNGVSDTDTISFAMKNGLLYFTGTDMLTGYVYLGNGTPVMFAQDENGTWVPYDPSAPMDPPAADMENNKDIVEVPVNPEDLNNGFAPVANYTGTTTADAVADSPPSMMGITHYFPMLERVKEYASQIVIPDITPADLTQEGDMLVVSYAYMVKLLRANASFIIATEPGVTIPDAELDEAMKDVEPSLKAVGLKLAFKTNGKSITKLSISMKFDDSEMGKEFKEDAMFSTAALTAEFVNDGKTLKKLGFEIVNDFSELEKGLTPKSTIELSYTLNDKFEPVGIKADVSAYSLISNGMTGNLVNGTDYNNCTRKDVTYSNISKITLKASADLSKLSAKNAEVASVSFNMFTEKAFETERVYNVVDGEPTLVSENTKTRSTEGASSVELNAKINTKEDNVFTLAATLKTNIDSASITATGYTKTAPNFPKNVPAEITEFINNN